MGEQRGRRRRAAIGGIGLVGALGVLGVFAGGTTPAAGQESERPAGSWLGLAADNRAPAIIDSFDTLTLATEGVGPTIDGIPAEARLTDIAFAPDGRTAYAADSREGGGILIIDTRSLAVSGYIESDGIIAGLAVSADGSLIVAADTLRGVVVVIDTATQTALRDIRLDPVDAVPTGVAIAPDGSQVYVSYVLLELGGPSGLEIFDPASGDLQHSLAIAGVGAPTVTPDGATVYLTSTTEDREEVIAIDPRTGIERVRVGVDGANQVHTSPDGGPVVVLSMVQEEDGEGGVEVIVHLSQVDETGAESNRVLQDIPLPSFVFTPDGASLMAPVFGGDGLVIVDRATFEQGAPVQHVTDALAIAPDQAPVAVLAPPSVTGLGSDTVLDASGSYSPTGSVVRWDWDFGDGTTASTTEPIVHHRYEHPGPHTVRVTVTNSAGTSTEVVHTGKQVLRNGGPSALATATAEVRGLAATGVDPASAMVGAGALIALAAAVLLGARGRRRPSGVLR